MILEQLKADKIKAMKMHDEAAKSALTSVLGAVTNAAIAQGCKNNITDELVNAVLLKEKKTMQEMIDTCPAERRDLQTEYLAKMQVICQYAPSMITDKEAIKTKILASGILVEPSKRGEIMKYIKAAGNIDMKVANQVVAEMIKEVSNG